MSDAPRRGDRGDGPRKPAGPRGRGAAGGRGAADRAGAGKPRRDGEKPPWKKQDGDKPAWKKREGDKPAWKKREDAPTKPGRDGDRRPPRARDVDTDAAPRHDDPHIPDDVAANQLDKLARAELKTLSKDNADWVARHLVMASRLIDDDPALAHRHALAAARRAGRVGVVRETVAITAYAIGDFALALRELRTHRRISGSNDQLPLMVDSERGVGRPDKALELGRSVPRAELPVAVQVALAIAMSGARLDLGQPEEALLELRIPQLDPDRAFEWSPALFDAYATVLEELGRADEAAEWFARSDRATAALQEAVDPDAGDVIEIVEESDDPA
ncbi:MAG TPA: hypothetical protein VL294_02420 [Pseudolysinimonas sp.]|jgi:hypothetical protein|nr:hypothetical protein [Pseudolysinimonas sp.]